MKSTHHRFTTPLAAFALTSAVAVPIPYQGRVPTGTAENIELSVVPGGTQTSSQHPNDKSLGYFPESLRDENGATNP